MDGDTVMMTRRNPLSAPANVNGLGCDSPTRPAPWPEIQRVPDTLANRQLQATLDLQIDLLAQRWDLRRGLLDTARFDTLPHETHPCYWELTPQQQSALGTPEIHKVYHSNSGRFGVNPLGLAAFCYAHPFSRHRGRAELLRYFQAGLGHFTRSVRADGLLGAFGLNGHIWAHGWDVEGLIYGMRFLGDALDRELMGEARSAFSRAADYVARLSERTSGIGSVGNQRMVYALALWNYGQLLDRADLRQLSDKAVAEVLHLVLDDSGQVIEQHGPCMHYSFTGFFYAWLHVALRRDESEAGRIVEVLRWFRNRCTRSLRPMAGPSSRMYYETMPAAVIADILPAAVQVSPIDSSLQSWVMLAIEEARRHVDASVTNPQTLGTLGHGASPLMWAQLMSIPEVQFKHASSKNDVAGPMGVRLYNRTNMHGRSPLQTLHVQRRYQTQFTIRDMLPFAGIQTWAWGDEPPVLHPTPAHPSTTTGWGIDTARQGASHNWGLYGAGAMGVDCYLHWHEGSGEKVLPDGADPQVCWLVARYDWLWRVVVFTPRSTVIVEFGQGGERKTTWTLDRVDATDVQIGVPCVRFAGREACLYSTLPREPKLLTHPGEKPSARDVRQLEYACGKTPVAFALSNTQFGFDSSLDATPGVLDFHEADHDAPTPIRYRLMLDPRLFQTTPGNFGVDVFHLVRGTSVVRI